MREGARPATADDVAVLVELHRRATEELAAEKGGAIWARHARRQGAMAVDPADDTTLVLVGTIDDAVVGYARVAVEGLDDGGELAVLSDIYVEPDAREVGVGEALLDAAMAWARHRGCVGIDSLALPGMRATKNFFEAAGLVARAIVVHRSFSE